MHASELEGRAYDVVIVGGRPAGASLALRLGAAGLQVLIVDQASFPSRPAVSAAYVLPHALELLDELELDEREYAANTPKLRLFMLEFASYFRTELRFDEPTAGRDYCYAIDRAKLDACVWHALTRCPTVTACTATRFAGVKLAQPGAAHEVQLVHERKHLTVRARALVGADGRYSPVANAVAARVLVNRTDVETSLYYAHWRGVSDYTPGVPDAAHIHASCDGFSFVLMPSADGETMVVAQGRSDRYLAQPGTPQEVYDRLLQTRPLVQRRLRDATQVSPLSGIKHMGNKFRQAFGPGWALVGDAYHQKDSLDAQGIYDALLGSKLLAEALIEWQRGQAWESALASYESRAWAALKPMFDATMQRVKREIYNIPPAPIARTLLRYVLTHPTYARRFASIVTRKLAPDQLLPPRMFLKLAAEGALRHGKQRLLHPGTPDPTDALRP
jgi:2-polyprenyl-6-methoxyphenol hydroxylase-like FAD-dependent oxidoreductase